MNENTENDWVQRAKQGDPTAIAELFRHYWRAARATAYGVTADFALAEDADFITNGRLSDSLVLMWMRSGTIDLHAVEELLRQLSEKIVPQMEVRFLTCQEPRYRSALRMQFKDITIPAAMGGPLNPWPNMPDGVNTAIVQICLESWATAQSGKVLELTCLSDMMDLIRNKDS